MSIKVMTMVFDRYPGSGNEMLLALALADHAQDDGSRIWPSHATLAQKSRMDERTVRRKIRDMEASGWLIPVRRASGRKGDTNEYQISPEWIAGRQLPPPADASAEGRAAGGGPDGPPDNLSCGQVSYPPDMDDHPQDKNGYPQDTAVSAESSGTIRNPSPPPPAEAGATAKPQQPKAGPVPVLRTREQRAWQTKRSGIEWMARELGMGAWDPGPYGMGKDEPFAAFERRVVEQFVSRGGRLEGERRQA